MVHVCVDLVLALWLCRAWTYLLLISEVEETEIFKICLEYWQHLACTLYNDSGPAAAGAGAMTGATQLLGGITITNLNLGQNASMRRSLYKQALSKVRLLFFLYSTVSINSFHLCAHCSLSENA